MAHFKLRQYDQAIADFDKAISLNPEDTVAATGYFCRSNACYALKQYSRAINDFGKTIEIEPNYAFAYSPLQCLSRFK
jgi:tetratricopeptide (TPR) repeat protein